MARGASTAFVNALIARKTAFPLVEIDFSTGTEYMCGLDHDVAWNGHTYLGLWGVMSIGQIEETGSSVQGIELRFSGVNSSAMSIALSSSVQGRGVRVRMAALDAANAVQVDSNVWSGLGDVWTIDESNASIVLTAEHRLAMLDRAKVRRLTDAQQQALYPGDLGCQYAADIENDSLVWPGKVA
jgi:hypothetical protein